MDAVNINFLGMSVAVSLSRFLISSYWYTSATLQVYMFKSCRLLATLLKVLHSYCCSAAVQIFHTFAIIIYYQYLQSLCEMWETLCMLYHSLLLRATTGLGSALWEPWMQENSVRDTTGIGNICTYLNKRYPGPEAVTAYTLNNLKKQERKYSVFC